jgi:serine protease Do
MDAAQGTGSPVSCLAAVPLCRELAPMLILARSVAATLLLLLSYGAAPRQTSAQETESIAGVQSKVVKIFGAGGLKGLAPYGSGFVVSAEGHIVTVWSHVLDSDVVTVVLDNGRRHYAKVLGAEPQLDLAVLKIDGEDLPHFDVKSAVVVGVGTRVLAFSNLFKVATGDEPVSVMHGVVSTTTKLDARRGRFQAPYSGPVYIVDAVTNNPGAAGGVLTTQNGRLVGMIGRELRSSDTSLWLNYVVPMKELEGKIGEIISGKFSSSTLENEAPPPETAISPLELGLILVPDVVYRTPAYIDQVVPGSQAAALDLRPDDLIVFVNNEVVPSIRSLQGELSKARPGSALNLVVRRGKALISVTLDLPLAPGDR